MVICIYAEALKPPTTGTPMRNLIYNLIERRQEDNFILVLRSSSSKDIIINQFLSRLSNFSNWKVHIESKSRRLTNILALFRLKDYCKISVRANVYISPDAHSLGKIGHPLIVVIHDLSSFESSFKSSFKFGWQRYLRRFLIRNAIEESDKVIAISEYTKDSICNYFPRHCKKVSVVYNSLDMQWITQETSINPPGTYFIWWGADSPRKNLEGLINAFAYAIKEFGIPFKLLLVCSNGLTKNTLGLIDKLRISDKVNILPSQDLTSLIELVDHSKGLLFPSFVEGFGMPVIEAFARGKAVLTSNSSSLIEVSNGLAEFVDPLDYKSIANGIVKLSQTSEDEEVIAHRRRWASNFSARRAGNLFENWILATYKEND